MAIARFDLLALAGASWLALPGSQIVRGVGAVSGMRAARPLRLAAVAFLHRQAASEKSKRFKKRISRPNLSIYPLTPKLVGKKERGGYPLHAEARRQEGKGWLPPPRRSSSARRKGVATPSTLKLVGKKERGGCLSTPKLVAKKRVE
jgi:hypothetical protein